MHLGLVLAVDVLPPVRRTPGAGPGLDETRLEPLPPVRAGRHRDAW